MRFRRDEVASFAPDSLRALGARHGWLVETPDELRVGFGRAVVRVHLTAGLATPTDARAELDVHDIGGADGPAGSGVVAFGSLPFDRTATGLLEIPEWCVTQLRNGDAWLTKVEGSSDPRSIIDATIAPDQGLLRVRDVSYQPAPDEYAHRVAQAVEILRRKEIDKVVLARAVVGSVEEPIDPAAVAQRLRAREPVCTLYSLPTPGGRRLVGASPELLLRRRGGEVLCHPLAGTIALPADTSPDDYHTWLLGSTKNLHEHEIVVDDIVRNLAQAYDDIDADARPSIVALRTVAHLGTWISARSHDAPSAPDALDVLRMLHPTAAVGGIPRERAYELLRQLELNDRGHFAGPLGWMDQEGDGDWWIAIRGVVVEERNFEAWAGAGIVSESDPVAEREETANKLAAVLSAIVAESL